MNISDNSHIIEFVSDDINSEKSDLTYKNIALQPRLHFTSIFTGSEIDFIEHKVNEHFRTSPKPSYSIKYFCITMNKKDKKQTERYIKAEEVGEQLIVQVVSKDCINTLYDKQYDSNRYAEIIKHIEQEHKAAQTATLPFYIRMLNYFEDNNITKKQFLEYGMNVNYYHKCKYPNYTPSMGKFVAIAIVCDMPLVLVIDLLGCLGCKFDANNKLHNAYIYLLNNYKELYRYVDKGNLLEECDKILRAMGYFGKKQLLSEVSRG